MNRSTFAGSTLSRLVLVLVTLAGCQTEQPLRFAVTFQDAQGIERGDQVMFKGLEIGEVVDVGVDTSGAVSVAVEVEPKYRGAVARSSVVEVERAGVLGGRELVIRDGDDDGERVAILDGEVLVGRESELVDAMSKLRSASESALERMRGIGNDLQQRIAELGDSEQAAELTQAMEDVREQLLEAGRVGSERVREDGLQAVRERAEELRRSLEAEGRGDEARELVDRVQRWLEETRNELDLDPGEAPGPDSGS